MYTLTPSRAKELLKCRLLVYSRRILRAASGPPTSLPITMLTSQKPISNLQRAAWGAGDIRSAAPNGVEQSDG